LAFDAAEAVLARRRQRPLKHRVSTVAVAGLGAAQQHFRPPDPRYREPVGCADAFVHGVGFGEVGLGLGVASPSLPTVAILLNLRRAVSNL
jgi:hypothetical protein